MDEPKEARRRQDEGLPEREVPRSDQPPGTHRERPPDPHEIPLETDEGQGPVGSTYPLSSREAAVGGQRGADVQGASAGAAGLAERENRDAAPRRRREHEP